ncbi:hypothetical protein [Litorisediminicola beolgyonensis]|uniref:Uncharacterized protein n=1 Tax=Litorisediminicola beolgyonensis TaxID=1173614 RepID=A0ABW3ZH41_9RHOB
MADSKDTHSTPLGTYPAGGGEGVTGLEISAAALSALWLFVAGLYFVLGGAEGADGLRFLLAAMVLFLPVAMIWVAVAATRATRIMRHESTRLQAAVDALRQAYVAQAKSNQNNAPEGISKKLDAIAASQKKTETAFAMFSSTRAKEQIAAQAAPGAAPSGPAGEQASLALGTPAEALRPPLSNADLIRALNFPETAEDQAGFAALRKALKDRPAAQFVQAAQDVLTLLSQDGIYMDDLSPDLARPEIWRRFAQGERGRAIAALGGIRDRSSLALTAGRMKQDPIFRDAAHHFLRLYDRGFARFAETATDAEISEFAGTRTSRAFMLIGRVAGTFN